MPPILFLDITIMGKCRIINQLSVEFLKLQFTSTKLIFFNAKEARVLYKLGLFYYGR